MRVRLILAGLLRGDRCEFRLPGAALLLHVLLYMEGALGTLFWMNTYLDKHGLEPPTMENPIAREIIGWVQQQYAKGATLLSEMRD